MLGRREQIEKWFYAIVERFRQKGAIGQDKAMTAEELGLPPRFEEAMKRRQGRSGVFVEVNGKYYLSEERLKELEELRSTRGGAQSPRKKMRTFRTAQLVIAVVFVALFLISLFVQSFELRIASGVLLVLWLMLLILQIYYLTKARRNVPFYLIENFGSRE